MMKGLVLFNLEADETGAIPHLRYRFVARDEFWVHVAGSVRQPPELIAQQAFGNIFQLVSDSQSRGIYVCA